MEAHPQAAPGRQQTRREEQRNALAIQWRQLTRAATFVALLTSPAFFVILYQRNGWGMIAALVLTFLAVISFRGLIDGLARKGIPSPSLYGATSGWRTRTSSRSGVRGTGGRSTAGSHIW